MDNQRHNPEDNPKLTLRLTAEEIDSKRTPKGGWTRADLAAWGVPWPAPRGWRKALLNGEPIPTFASPGPPVLPSGPSETYRAIGCVQYRGDGVFQAVDGRDGTVLGTYATRDAAWRRADELGMEQITFQTRIERT